MRHQETKFTKKSPFTPSNCIYQRTLAWWVENLLLPWWGSGALAKCLGSFEGPNLTNVQSDVLRRWV